MNTGDSEDDFRTGLTDFKVTWTCAYQGEKDSPIADLYRVEAYPTILILDGEGRIRHRGVRGARLMKAVVSLLDEARREENRRADEEEE